MSVNLKKFFAIVAILGIAVNASATTAPKTQSSVAALQVVLGLVVVVVAIFLLAWLVKRVAPGNLTGNKHMRVISYLMLSNREKAVLVQVGDKQLLIGVAPGRVSTLCEFEQPVVVSEGERSEGLPFTRQLFQGLRKTDDASDLDSDRKPLSDFSHYLKNILSNGQSK